MLGLVSKLSDRLQQAAFLSSVREMVRSSVADLESRESPEASSRTTTSSICKAVIQRWCPPGPQTGEGEAEPPLQGEEMRRISLSAVVGSIDHLILAVFAAGMDLGVVLVLGLHSWACRGPRRPQCFVQGRFQLPFLGLIDHKSGMGLTDPSQRSKPHRGPSRAVSMRFSHMPHTPSVWKVTSTFFWAKARAGRAIEGDG